MRGPLPGPHQLQNSLSHNAMLGLSQPNKLDLRAQGQAQLLSMGNNAGVGVGASGTMRGPGVGFNPQQGPTAQLQAPHIAMRQQPQQLPPHMIPPHMLPPHLQQQGPPGANAQPAHDLMALLMGGPPRE